LSKHPGDIFPTTFPFFLDLIPRSLVGKCRLRCTEWIGRINRSHTVQFFKRLKSRGKQAYKIMASWKQAREIMGTEKKGWPNLGCGV
jgi:hypothetical protein